MGAHSLDQTGICMNDDVAPPVVGSRRAPPETEIQTATERMLASAGRRPACGRCQVSTNQPTVRVSREGQPLRRVRRRERSRWRVSTDGAACHGRWLCSGGASSPAPHRRSST